jgi:hypothetical protein
MTPLYHHQIAIPFKESPNMKKLMASALVAVSLSLVGLVWAHEDHPMSPAASSAEFNRIKQLAGKWQGTMSGGEKGHMPDLIVTEYKLTAGGSAVEETLTPGTPHEMVDMYHDQDGQLVMTHYCAMGTQPHMVLKSATPLAINLEMGPTPGINAAKDSHMHALTLEFPDANHLVQKWTSYANGKPAGTTIFTLARVK